jgi:hypothetical protein
MFIIKKANRKNAKLRLALTGVSNSGKTTGALKIAKGLGGKIVVIDTENKSADLYSDITDFDTLVLQAPYSPERYIQAIKQCEEAGYNIIIIDSLSHGWAGEGGVLEIQDNITAASKSKNSYTAWREVTPVQNKLVDTILQSDCHIIATMRSKTAYELVDINGRKTPIKMGLAPIQREGIDYEFTIVLDLDAKSHLYTASKDRTRLFEGKHETISEETGIKLNEWLNNGKTSEEVAKEEEEEKKNIINELNNALSVESLTKLYKSAKYKFPQHDLEFIELAKKRKEIINSNLVGEIH